MNDFTKAIIVNVIALLLCSLILMGLWNWLMPVIFNLSTITYIQAIGLYLLSGMLFRNHMKTDED